MQNNNLSKPLPIEPQQQVKTEALTPRDNQAKQLLSRSLAILENSYEKSPRIHVARLCREIAEFTGVATSVPMDAVCEVSK